MEVENLNRFDRIVAIMVHLQSGRVIKAQEMAERFDVSLRTIYRDIKSLEAAGMPLIGEPGVGYSVMEGYKLPPVMFTREEAGSFVAAEKLMQQFTDKKLGSVFESAMYKVKSVLRGHAKDYMEALETQVMVSPAHEMFNEHIPNALEILLDCIAEKKQVQLKYKPFFADSHSNRNVEPIGLFHENGYWYMMGYCHLRNDYRQFRTDRIEYIEKCVSPFTKVHGAVSQYMNKPQCDTLHPVTIRVKRSMAKYIQTSKKFYGFVSEKNMGDQVEMHFLTQDIEEAFPRWYLMFADKAEIVEPYALKHRLKKLIEQMAHCL